MKGEKTIFTLRNRRNTIYVKLLSPSSKFLLQFGQRIRISKRIIYMYMDKHYCHTHLRHLVSNVHFTVFFKQKLSQEALSQMVLPSIVIMRQMMRSWVQDFLSAYVAYP